ncbi:hypothetical protein FACS1894203_3770 [Bacteroidia bacterium]|nr:hypothetical protein FACS1894203_3770 [Bacteroidia bacterium]
MSKFKNWKQLKIGNYFRELSIVIIGVAVTLYVSTVVSETKERKDLELQLNTVYTELKDNLQRIDSLIEHRNKSKILSKYLVEYYHNPGPVVADSIHKYSDVIGYMHLFVYKKGAYDMFMNSGAMKLFNDKELLLDITDCYAMIEELKEDHVLYESQKLEQLKKIFDYDFKIVEEGIDLTSSKFRKLYNFFLMFRLDDIAEKTREKTEKVLSNRKEIKE